MLPAEQVSFGKRLFHYVDVPGSSIRLVFVDDTFVEADGNYLLLNEIFLALTHDPLHFITSFDWLRWNQISRTPPYLL